MTTVSVYADYKAHPVRNRMAILAVTLTTILICVVFTVGFGFTTALSLSFGASPGPGADSCSIYGFSVFIADNFTVFQMNHTVRKLCNRFVMRNHNNRLMKLLPCYYGAESVFRRVAGTGSGQLQHLRR